MDSLQAISDVVVVYYLIAVCIFVVVYCNCIILVCCSIGVLCTKVLDTKQYIHAKLYNSIQAVSLSKLLVIYILTNKYTDLKGKFRTEFMQEL